MAEHISHLPERAGHSPDKAPLALHIGFQIFCALPVCLLDCFRVTKLCFLPQQHTVLKFSRHFPGIFNPLLLCGIQYKMILATRPAAFDIRG